jgi:NADH:ubiquinone oxidoreductase subunit F (NADH-binding)
MSVEVTDRPPLAAHRRLLRVGGRGESYDEYVAQGGYPPHAAAADALAAAESSGLAGRGGAGFPLARKLRAVASSADPHRIVVANGEEGEPGSVKDRILMRTRPHVVLDGLRLAALAVDAADLYVYVSDPASARSIRGAVVQAASTLPAITVVEVAPSYVAGEESALVRFLDGGPALPTAKPPRAFEVGVGGHPTAVSNVETLAHLANAVAAGAAAEAIGTVLLTVSGDLREPKLVEAPRGVTLRSVIGEADVAGVLCGGLFGGLRRPAVLDVPLDHAAMRDAGTALGCGAFYVMSGRGCPVEVATDAIAYLARESSQQCGVCMKGTAAMADAMRRLSRSEATDNDLEPLIRWSTNLRGRGNCALLDAACEMLASLFGEWDDAVRRHSAGEPCVVCRSRADDFRTTRLAVDPATVSISEGRP